jgi:TolB-like protein
MNTQSDGVASAGAAGDRSVDNPKDSVATPGRGERLEKAGKRSRRRAAKLRSVWISFAGRIVAQFVGSAASIVLGISLIHNYKAPAQGPENAAIGSQPASYPGRVARVTEDGGRRRPSIVVLPVDDYSVAAPADSFPQALTDVVTASLAERGSLTVLSRTSASQIGAHHGSVPATARELGVDLVLESSVTRSANRIRVVVQLIDGRSDEHLWTGRFDREAGDPFVLQSEIADRVARGIEAAVSDSALRPLTMATRSTSGGGATEFDGRARLLLPAATLARVR